MAATTGQHAAFERAFASKNYKLGDALLAARAQQLAQQLHITPEAFANQYDSFALVSDWSMDVTGQRLKMVADYLEGEQRKENARPRAAAAGGLGAGSAVKTAPQVLKPTWDDLPDKLDYRTPSAKRQALDPAAVNPGTASKAAAAASGTTTKPDAAAAGAGSQNLGRPGTAAAAGTPQAEGAQARHLRDAGTPLAGGTAAVAGTPSAPPSAFAQRTNRGQMVAVLNDHLPGPAAYRQQQQQGPSASGSSTAAVAVRPVGHQPPLDAAGLLFMMEVLETKVHALDERIMDFADALTAVTNCTAALPQQQQAGGTPGPAATTLGAVTMPTPPPHGAAIAPGATPPPPPGAAMTPGGAAITPGGDGNGGRQPAEPSAAQPLHHSVSDISHQPVWVAGRVVAEAEGAPLNAESLLLEGCREASGGARVRLDVSCLPAFRLFPGQSVCAYGLNPTGGKFIAQRLVTHIPPPPPRVAAVTAGGNGGPDGGLAASREVGLSLVVAAGPYCLTEDLSYSPLEELLSYCTANPPDVLLLMGPFVDCEQPGLASGAADRTAEEVLREELTRRLAAWRAAHPAAVVALMPAVRDVTALPVLPQPPLTATAQAVGPADKAVALQNPSTVSLGPLVAAACSADVLKALSAAELSRVPPGATGVERLPALASHVIGQRSFYPLYPAPLGACLDTSHYSQLQLTATPDLLIMPSDLAPFAKILAPVAWAAGAPPGLEAAAGAGGVSSAVASAAPVVVLNPGRVSRGSAGGTFAHVVVAPGAAPVLERIRVEVRRV